jgi:cytidylate kinase
LAAGRWQGAVSPVWLRREVSHDHLEKTDRGRQRHLKTRFRCDIDDPHLYDLVINTDRMTSETAARLMVEGVRNGLADLRAPRPAPSWQKPATP